MTTRDILERLPQLAALVVGDICLDRWCRYDPALAEPSRETGIPRLAVVTTEITAGAGGTVANNLAALGVGRVSVLGVAGNDGFGYELKQALAARQIDSNLLVTLPGWPTFTYTKVINITNDEEDHPRLDFISTRDLPIEAEALLVARLRESAARFDVILVSDQAETEHGGMVGGAIREELSQIASADPKKIIWVDSRLRVALFRKVIVKANEDEAAAACQRAFGEVDYSKLQTLTVAPLLVVTHGGDGVSLIETGGSHRIATAKVANPIDICGAGDSFSAGAAMALAANADAESAARFGNAVASITIMKRGTGTASPAELLAL